MECFKAHHRFGDLFDKAVVLLKEIIEVFICRISIMSPVPVNFRMVLMACSLARLAPLLSMMIFSGTSPSGCGVRAPVTDIAWYELCVFWFIMAIGLTRNDIVYEKQLHQTS